MSKSDRYAALKSCWITRLRSIKKREKEEGPSPGPVKIYFSKDFSSCWHSSEPQSSSSPCASGALKAFEDSIKSSNESKGFQGGSSHSQDNIVPKEKEEKEKEEEEEEEEEEDLEEEEEKKALVVALEEEEEEEEENHLEQEEEESFGSST